MHQHDQSLANLTTLYMNGTFVSNTKKKPYKMEMHLYMFYSMFEADLFDKDHMKSVHIHIE